MANLENPLLNNMGIPKFDLIQPEHVAPAVKVVLSGMAEEITKLEKSYSPTWSGLMEPLSQIIAKMEAVWRPVGHLLSVKNSKELRAVYESSQNDVVSFYLILGQNRIFYQGMKELRDSSEWQNLDEAQKRIVDASILSAELTGIALEGTEKERFNELSKQMSEIQTKFENNVLDSTKEFKLVLEKRDEVAGLPESYLAASSQAYNANFPEKENSTPANGPWLITLDGPSYLGFLNYADRRDLRMKVMTAYFTKASSGETDNNENIKKILLLRKEKARLLGYADFAELSLAMKMAKNADEVYELEYDLLKASKKYAEREHQELENIAKSGGVELPLYNSDIYYWSQKLQEEKFEFNDEQLKPYLSMPKVLDGMFSLVKNIFGINVVAADGEAATWHPDVRFFKIFDDQQNHIASFFLDPYARPENKRGGAWMNVCVDRKIESGKLVVPVAYLVCNSTSPIGDKPSLLTFDEMTTLFHEFGHGLQHMLTTVNYPEAAGINLVEWDAVELPSQFMENWCYHRDTLLGLAKHFETGETLPDELFQKILASKTFRAGSHMVRQLYLGLIDMDLHVKFDPNGSETIYDVQRKVAEKTLVLPLMEEDRFLCSFGHIFAGGYAAGYYSYKWAEVLSSDAFAAFEEVGLDNSEKIKEVGYRFRDTVLGMGGGSHPSEVYEKFRGRAPSTEALLRHSGLES